MAERLDILLDSENNFSCVSGDFETGECDAQNVDLLLVSTKGSFKESPTVGAGLVNFLKKADSSIKDMKREITVQLAADGYKLTDFFIDADGEYQVEYKNNY